ncbi:CDC73-domain-containing protein [Dacryopinax primogenitus]|uniref:CDC73-domain-containing protein n=1 Tax=Dacryopinax primogenitus (strain DJM 731) TaxID=1858805 RepID=M5GBR3_DACPD|nr:CDC73-domain-containing protein [Dacryopinax primogenitus]EJU05870.1 CDC73-domain-containing protein [Dacryopinax primogenitus]
MATDPLLLLRQSLQSSSPPLLLLSASANNDELAPSLAISTHILLPPLTLPKSTPTRLLRAGVPSSPPPSPEQEPDKFYTLDSVYYVYLARADGPGDYFRKARDAALSSPAVSLVDRRAVLAWLTDATAPEPENFVPLPSPTEKKAYIAPPEGPFTPPGSPPPGYLDKFRESKKRRYVPDEGDREFVKRLKAEEVLLRDRNSVLRGWKLNNYSELRTIIQKRLKASKDPQKPAARPAPEAKAKKSRNQHPIIMISSSPTSLITMHNVKLFLEFASFLPSSVARDQALAEGIQKAEDVIPVYRKRVVTLPSGEVQERLGKYFVVDGVEALGKFGFGGDPWDRVVCVLTTGQSWQFKPYKWPDPKQLFHHVKGVYVQWAHEPSNASVKDWNVSVLKIDQSRRHVDKSVVAQFWKELDQWVGIHKPWLAGPT